MSFCRILIYSISSFNFPTSTTANVAAKTTHLSNQDYEICIRREAGTCYICYTVQKMAAAANTPGDQNSFGLRYVQIRNILEQSKFEP